MNAVNRARIIFALKILAVLTFLAPPLAYLCVLGTYDAHFSYIFLIATLVYGAVVAVACLAGIIIIEAAHWYISDKEREAGVEE